MARESSSAASVRAAAWERIRTLGRQRYIWQYGVLRWGGFMFCFSLAVYHYRQFGRLISSEGHLWFRLLLGAVVWAYVGYLYGRASWHQNERNYRARRSAGGTSVEM